MRSLINQLMHFDFTEGEAKVYASLIQQPLVSGYEAAKNSGVARSKVYDILDSLHRKGAIVVSNGEKSKQYSPIPINKLVALLERKVKLELTELEGLGEQFELPRDNQAMWMISDYQAAILKAIELIRDAKQELLIQIWQEDLTEEIEQEILQRKAAGIKTVCVLYDQAGQYNTQIPNVFKHGFEKRKLKQAARWLTIASDNDQMLHMSVVHGDNFHAMYTGNSAMTHFAREYILHDAYCLNLINRLRDNVQDTFGSDMEEIQNVFL